MKTNSHSIRISGIIALTILLSTKIFAQPTLPGDYVPFSAAGPESIDTVTVGSHMAYKVAGDPVIAGLPSTVVNPSIFKWIFSPAVTIKKIDGSADLTTVEPNYYLEKEIRAVMPVVSTPTTMTLTINEKVRPVSGTGCEGTDSVANILVVLKPTLQWPGTKEISGCTATDVPITLSLTGYSQWVVTYNVLYTAYTSGALQTMKLPNQTATIGSNKTLTIDNSVFDADGKYEIQIVNLTDRISRKSLDQDAVKALAGTNIPAATDLYTINVLPTPKTKKLQHVRNMP